MEDALITFGMVALVVTLVALSAAVVVGLQQRKTWEVEREKRDAQAVAVAAAKRASEDAAELYGRALSVQGLVTAGPIVAVKTTRKGRSRADQSIVAASEVLREVDS